MLSQVASKFPMIWLTCLGMLIFLGVFLGVVAWVFRRGSTELYQHIAEGVLS
jgi:cbb3-type cytochrome oxidase subunit 3